MFPIRLVSRYLLPFLLLLAAAGPAAAEKKPVYVGLDAELSYAGSTSAQAIRMGMLIAMEEVNQAGGVLGGRPLKLIARDNKSLPARSLVNLKELAAQPDLVAVFSALERIKTTQTVRVCIWPDYYGITFRNPKTQQLTGIDIDMAQALGQDLGAKVEFVDSSFAKLVDDVAQDRCDVAMFAIGITPTRQAKLRFTQPHLASDIFAITSKTNRRIKDWGDIDKADTVVAVAKGTLHEPVMKDKLKLAQLLVLDTPFAREQEVQSGRADVFMTDYPYSQRFLVNADWARLVSPPGSYHITPYGYAMKPGDDAWHTRLERFVSDIKRDGRLAAAAKQHKLTLLVAP